MNEYENRLIKCGFTPKKAHEVYIDYIRNFTLAELEVYVRFIESKHNVDRV